MIRRLVLRLEAEQDMASARDWYDRRRVGLGDEFLDCVSKRINQIEQSPDQFAAGYREVRRAKTRRFPYVIYFRTTDERIEVLAVLHGGRNPSAWRKRV